jgi:hypothetical protein
MPHDYGYFGKGLTGYAHYMQALNDSKRGGKKPSGSRGGCLTTLALPTLGIALFLLIVL